MGSVSLGIMQARTAVERVVAIEDVGKAIVRWGLHWYSRGLAA
jgi:hypothetical protein